MHKTIFNLSCLRADAGGASPDSKQARRPRPFPCGADPAFYAMISMFRLISPVIAFFFVFFATSDAHGLEGDWTAGAAPAAIIIPQKDVYGGGASIFARYAVLDALELGLSSGFYGARNTKNKYALGLYNVRFGVNCILDILQWVPSAGIHFSALFSEDSREKYHRGGRGLALDFEVGVQYRGIRQFGIGIFFAYHLVFIDDDYMTAGISLQWHSGLF